MASATLWVGLDRGDADQPHLEQHVLAVLAELPGPAATVCTHLLRGHGTHHAASVALCLEAGDPLAHLEPLRRASARFGGALAALGPPDAPALELGEERLRAGARSVAEALRAGTGGRAIRFPGQEALVGQVRVADVPRLSAIASLAGVGGELDGEALLDTRGFVRPAFADGALRLTVVPAVGGTVVPHERPRLHDCGSCGH